MAATTTLYDTLGVTRSATTEEIRRAYRALAKRHHPDAARAPGSDQRFAEIASAYEVLANPDKRRAYDEELAGVGRSAGSRAAPGPAHYTWTNVASPGGRASVSISEFDELYDTFFTPRPGNPPRKDPTGQSG